MRLAAVARGKSFSQRLKFGLIKLLVGRVPGPILTMSHRPELFGRWFALGLQDAMRGPSEWSVGEREIFSAVVSKLNHCEY